MVKEYYRLTKPGIIYGNIMTAASGFFLASKGHINYWLLIYMILGTSLVIASACVFNNYIDRDIDKLMLRTKKRALARDTIPKRSALLYAAMLGITGIILLIIFTNYLTVLIGAVAFIDYVILYGYSKRKSVHGTLVGSISGSAPIVAGYCSVANHLGIEALLLFIILTLWQMPHFYSIAIFRLKDYAAAKLPVLPVKKGVYITKVQITLYIVAFIIATAMMSVLGYTGYIYLVVMSIIGLLWLYKSLQGFRTDSDVKWARKLFGLSLLVITVFSVIVSFGALLA